MDQMRNFGDDRMTAGCVYCGGPNESREHVPSRVLLDEPFPENLPVVPACRNCNQSFSRDELYLACLIECARGGTVGPGRLGRPKVSRLLREHPNVCAKLAHECSKDLFGSVAFSPDWAAVQRVLTKLAQGHVLFEMNELVREAPREVRSVPLFQLSAGTRTAFEEPEQKGLAGGEFIHAPWPEVGSRAMQRLLVTNGKVAREGWVEVQAERYRYLVLSDAGPVVRMVLSEYLAAEVAWG